MAATTTFPDIEAGIGTKKKKTSNIFIAMFDDGYEQRGRNGINTRKQIWNVVFDNILNADADTIEAFFDARGGTDPFKWTPPNESTERQFIEVADSFNRTPGNPNTAIITVQFREVFDL